MYTPSDIATRIVAAVTDRFADDNGIVREHLTTAADEITPGEIARAHRALGSGVIFDA